MPLVLETGVGVRNANSYVLPSFVTTYLTDRNRVTESNWSTIGATAQEAACIAATDYIDTRWGSRFKGTRLVTLNDVSAIARLDFSGQPTASQTVTIGARVYTFVASLDEFASDEVVIGATTDDTVQNLIDAVNGATSDQYSTFSDANQQATAALVEGSTTAIKLTAAVGGTAGNDLALSTTAGSITVTSGFVHGADFGSQPLEFPRQGIYNQDGKRVHGIPLNLKQAAAEYAVRAAAASLWSDPTVDATGRAVVEKFEKVGPIEERTRYEEGASLSQLIKPYPAADRLLRDYVVPAGRVIRG